MRPQEVPLGHNEEAGYFGVKIIIHDLTRDCLNPVQRYIHKKKHYNLDICYYSTMNNGDCK